MCVLFMLKIEFISPGDHENISWSKLPDAPVELKLGEVEENDNKSIQDKYYPCKG